MMRLIDADELIQRFGLDKVTKYGNETVEQQTFSYSTMMMYEIADMIDDSPTVEPFDWIPLSEKLPECEHEVDVTIKRIVNYDNEDHEFIFTCRAFYEDGEMWSEDSSYYWEYEYEYDSTYDEEKDDFKVPKGWYEPTRFNETFAKIDDDCVILAWKPVVEPYRDI